MLAPTTIKSRVRLSMVAAVALTATTALAVPIPAGLSPRGEEWARSAVKLDQQSIGFCVYMKRKYSWARMDGPCTHRVPPVNDAAMMTNSPFYPFFNLPADNQIKIRSWLLAELAEPIIESRYAGFDPAPYPGAVAEEARRVAAYQQQASWHQTQIDNPERATKAIVTLVEIIILGSAGAAVWLVLRGRKRAKRIYNIKPGYTPPIMWMNYYDQNYKPPAPGRARRLHHPFTEDQSFLEERSNLPQFELWYFTRHYMTGDEERKNSSSGEWVSVVDGNPAIDRDPGRMPIFLQIPEDVSNELDKRAVRRNGQTTKTRLSLYTIELGQVQRLKSGPLRQEPFDLVEHSTGSRRSVTLTVGVLGGRWPAPIPDEPAGKAGGTSRASAPEGWS